MLIRKPTEVLRKGLHVVTLGSLRISSCLLYHRAFHLWCTCDAKIHQKLQASRQDITGVFPVQPTCLVALYLPELPCCMELQKNIFSWRGRSLHPLPIDTLSSYAIIPHMFVLVTVASPHFQSRRGIADTSHASAFVAHRVCKLPPALLEHFLDTNLSDGAYIGGAGCLRSLRCR